MGKLIVIDGLDGSGKETQAKELLRRLEQESRTVKKIEFPTYTKSSALLEMYLAGEFGDKPESVNAYAASTFFAVDRYASFKKEWQQIYENGGVILADRYTTSNAIHQLAKLPREEREPYLNWLWNFEFDKMKLPKPDLVIYLSLPVDFAVKLLEKRYDGDESKKDLHEKNKAYLYACEEAAHFSAEHLGWKRIECVCEGKLRSVSDIAEEIYQVVEKEKVFSC